MSFSLGTPKTASGFTLPTGSTPTANTTGLGGAGDTSTPNKPATNLFGSTPAATGFSLTSTSTPGGFSFGGGAAPAPATSATTGGFSLTPATKPTGFSLGGTATTTTATSGFSLGGATSTSGGFSLGANLAAASSAAATSASTSVAATTNIATGLQFSQTGGTTATTTTTSFTPIIGLGGTATTTTTSALKLTSTTTAASTAPTSSAAPTTTTTATIPATGSLTFAQLEDSINKWTIDLEEQGKFFINQAKELNAWDYLLISNGEKILALNETIERVKQQQKQLDQELDFVLGQQNELDELSLPLEKQLSEIPIADQGRYQMYQLSEVIDAQLKQMSEDLKEIVEHLNETNKTEDVSDPVTQISRILNAHMHSLVWIDQNTNQISNHLEQISKLHELHKNNHMNYN